MLIEEPFVFPKCTLCIPLNRARMLLTKYLPKFPNTTNPELDVDGKRVIDGARAVARTRDDLVVVFFRSDFDINLRILASKL